MGALVRAMTVFVFMLALLHVCFILPAVPVKAGVLDPLDDTMLICRDKRYPQPAKGGLPDTPHSRARRVVPPGVLLTTVDPAKSAAQQAHEKASKAVLRAILPGGRETRSVTRLHIRDALLGLVKVSSHGF